MALVHRSRINSTLTAENFKFITDLSTKTGLNQSKLFDLSVELLKKELDNKDLFDLLEEYSNAPKE